MYSSSTIVDEHLTRENRQEEGRKRGDPNTNSKEPVRTDTTWNEKVEELRHDIGLVKGVLPEDQVITKEVDTSKTTHRILNTQGLWELTGDLWESDESLRDDPERNVPFIFLEYPRCNFSDPFLDRLTHIKRKTKQKTLEHIS